MFCYAAMLDGIRERLSKLSTTTLARPVKAFLEEDQKAMKIIQIKEDQELEAVEAATCSPTKSLETPMPKVSANSRFKKKKTVAPVEETELAVAEAGWQAKAGREDNYDLQLQLNALESRIAGMMQSRPGVIDMTKATSDQVRAVVEKAKAYAAKQKADAEAALEVKRRAEQTAVADNTKNVKAQEQANAKSAAQKKASAYLKKMGGKK